MPRLHEKVGEIEVLCAEAAREFMPVTAAAMKPGDIVLWGAARELVPAENRARLAAAIAPPDQGPSSAPAFAAFYDGMLEQITRQLEAWAEESRNGGWSTHQVGPMQKLAATIRARPKRVLA